jgi:hypothetical protein
MKAIVLLSPAPRRLAGAPDGAHARLAALLWSSHAFTCATVSGEQWPIAGGAVFGSRADSPRTHVRPDYVFCPSRCADRVRNAAADRLLTALAAMGIRVGYDRDSSLWGIKSVFERRCRAYESVSGSSIPRPRTELVNGAAERGKISRFVARHGPSILKPHNSSRSRGIRILTEADQVPRLILGQDQYVLQELVADPMTLRGRKLELRVYVVINDLHEPLYRVSRTVLIKTAIRRHTRGVEDAEICGVAYAKRRGFVPQIGLLDDMTTPGRPCCAHWRAIRSSIHDVVSPFMRAVAWRARSTAKLPCHLFWGLDLAIQNTSSGPRALLLEANTFPALYQGEEHIDSAMDRLFVHELFGTV